MIIALTGLKGSGKSTAADFLVEEYGFKPVSFAQPMKDSVAALLDITLEDIEQMKNDPDSTITVTFPSGMRKTIPFRVFLQRYGTEAHREIPEFGYDIWTTMAEQKMIRRTDHVVVADCRFVNEAAIVRACGGVIIRVVRHAVVMQDGHESEAGLPEVWIDGELDNNGTLDELYDNVERLMSGNWRVSLPGVRNV